MVNEYSLNKLTEFRYSLNWQKLERFYCLKITVLFWVTFYLSHNINSILFKIDLNNWLMSGVFCHFHFDNVVCANSQHQEVVLKYYFFHWLELYLPKAFHFLLWIMLCLYYYAGMRNTHIFVYPVHIFICLWNTDKRKMWFVSWYMNICIINSQN